MTNYSYHLGASIVLYQNKATEIKGLISSLLQTRLSIKIYLIDNSPSDSLKRLATDSRIEYQFLNENIGYGRAHNIAIQKSLRDGIPYHLIMNPDVELEGSILQHLFSFMEDNLNVGCVVPKVLYADGQVQHLNKLYPTPFDLIFRRFLPNGITNKINWFDLYELKSLEDENIHRVPVASGCFMFCRCETLKQINGFDSRYFMYLEDTDLCRRINRVSKVVYYPKVSVIHGYAKGSYTNPKLLWYHIVSAVKYFNKWGWLIDLERKRVNRQYR